MKQAWRCECDKAMLKAKSLVPLSRWMAFQIGFRAGWKAKRSLTRAEYRTAVRQIKEGAKGKCTTCVNITKVCFGYLNDCKHWVWNGSGE